MTDSANNDKRADASRKDEREENTSLPESSTVSQSITNESAYPFSSGFSVKKQTDNTTEPSLPTEQKDTIPASADCTETPLPTLSSETTDHPNTSESAIALGGSTSIINESPSASTSSIATTVTSDNTPQAADEANVTANAVTSAPDTSKKSVESTSTSPAAPATEFSKKEHASSPTDKKGPQNLFGKLSATKNTQTGTSPKKAVQGKDPFFSLRPIRKIPTSMPLSVSSKIFNYMSYLPWLFLTLLLIGQTIFTLDARELWYSDEIRHANAFASMLENGKWFVLQMNGELYPDKPPLYFWFLRGIYAVLGQEGPRLYFIAAAVSSLFFLWSSLLLARIVGRMDGRTLLAGGIMLLSTLFMIGVSHYARMDLLFATFILLSETAFFVAFTQKRSFLFMLLGFAMAALACLVKGPLGIALPLATVICFLIWRGTKNKLFFQSAPLGLVAGVLVAAGYTYTLVPQHTITPLALFAGLGTAFFVGTLYQLIRVSGLRFIRLDIVIGVVVCVAIVVIWLAGVMFETENMRYIIDELWGRQVVLRSTNTFHHAAKWYYYLICFPLALLPWTMLIFCLPYSSLAQKNTWTAVAQSRTPENDGTAYLWSSVLSGVFLLSCLSGKVFIYILPVVPALLFLAARALLKLSGGRANLFRMLSAALLIFMGAALIYCSLVLFDILPPPAIKGWPEWHFATNPGFFFIAGAFIAAGLAILFLMRSARPEGILLIIAILSVVIPPASSFALPEIDTVMSPKNQAEVMKEYIKLGYTPVSYDVYGGTYTYYAGQPIIETNSQEKVEELLKNGNIILAMRKSKANKWVNKPDCLIQVHEQWIESSQYILFACPQSGIPVISVTGATIVAPKERQETAHLVPATNSTQKQDSDASSNGTNTEPLQSIEGQEHLSDGQEASPVVQEPISAEEASHAAPTDTTSNGTHALPTERPKPTTMER